MGWFSITHHDSEQAAFAVGGFTTQALGVRAYPPGYMGYDANHQSWNKGWRASEIERNRAQGIRNILQYYPDSGHLLYPD
jgi:hypothetical protein